MTYRLVSNGKLSVNTRGIQKLRRDDTFEDLSKLLARLFRAAKPKTTITAQDLTDLGYEGIYRDYGAFQLTRIFPDGKKILCQDGEMIDPGIPLKP